MATRSIQPDSWANAAGNLGEALFPSGRTVAAGKIAGQQLSELAARTRKATGEAAGIEDQNNSLAAAVLQAAGLDPREVAIMRAGRGNSQQMMEGLQTSQQMRGDMSAADAFTAGDFTGVGAGRLAGGREPLPVNKIEGGYQLNPYQAGGEIEATGETLADILAAQALAGQRDASAGLSRERTENPERFRAGARGAGGKPPEVSTAETKALADEIVRFLPKDTPAEDIMAATEAASRRLLAGETPAAAIQGGVADVFETVPEQTTGDDDWIPFNEKTVPAGKRRKTGAAPAPAASERQVARTGTLNGRRVVQYTDGTTEYAD